MTASSCETTRQIHYIDHCQIDQEAVSVAQEKKPVSEVSIRKCGIIKETLFLTTEYMGIFILRR